MKRYIVVFVLFILVMITHIDRVCVSASKEFIAGQLHLSDAAMGLIFSAWALGYAINQIPGGWLIDKVGPRAGLTVVVGLWSVMAILTGFAWSFTSLLVVRMALGMAEAGVFLGGARAIYNWLPPGERGRANGVLFSGSRISAAISLPLLAWMLARWPWRNSFLMLGAIGTVWTIFWLLWFRDRPAKPLDTITAASPVNGGLSRILRSGPMAFNMFQYFASNFTFFLCMSWMLPYLKREYRLGDSQAAAYAMIPLLVAATAQWSAGWLVDRLYHSHFRVWSRRLPGMLGFTLATVGMVALTRANAPALAVVYLSLAVFGAEMTLSPSWVFCADIAGANTGRVSGTMNMAGNIGSFISANAFPYLQRVTGSASAYFLIAAGLNAIAIVCWFHMRSIDERKATIAVAN
jgi:ACS family glucarate transporter-like MFS transporter